uniref:Uncharacterized protein n=1 Tax=Candidatus Kentrum sp. LFY TaxID=2126342 RepID=A0A450UZT4_9GAMM|nr:MAG: hypothetical protein BECKLFY1418B_GA0070995_11137 [Candidatus Kentron sp. LFY]
MKSGLTFCFFWFALQGCWLAFVLCKLAWHQCGFIIRWVRVYFCWMLECIPWQKANLRKALIRFATHGIFFDGVQTGADGKGIWIYCYATAQSE